MNGLQFGDVDGGVGGRGFQAFVSEKLLDVADVRPALQHVRCARMPEQMEAAFCAADVGGSNVFGDKVAERIGLERMAVAAIRCCVPPTLFSPQWLLKKPTSPARVQSVANLAKSSLARLFR